MDFLYRSNLCLKNAYSCLHENSTTIYGAGYDRLGHSVYIMLPLIISHQ